MSSPCDPKVDVLTSSSQTDENPDDSKADAFTSDVTVEMTEHDTMKPAPSAGDTDVLVVEELYFSPEPTLPVFHELDSPPPSVEDFYMLNLEDTNTQAFENFTTLFLEDINLEALEDVNPFILSEVMPTYDAEARSVCAIMVLGQLDIPLDTPSAFATRKDAEIWVAGKPPALIVLPYFWNKDQNIVVGAAFTDATQLLEEAGFITIEDNDMTEDLKLAAKIRRYAAEDARNYIRQAMFARIKIATFEELRREDDQIMPMLRKVPMTDYRAYCEALNQRLDLAKRRYRKTFQPIFSNLLDSLIVDLNDPESDLVRGFPDHGTYPDADHVPLFVRLYMDRVWYTAAENVENMLINLMNRHVDNWVDGVYRGAGVSKTLSTDTEPKTSPQADSKTEPKTSPPIESHTESKIRPPVESQTEEGAVDG